MKELNLNEIEQISGGYSAFGDLTTTFAGCILGLASVNTIFAASIAAGTAPFFLSTAGILLGGEIGHIIYNASSYTTDIAQNTITHTTTSANPV